MFSWQEMLLLRSLLTSILRTYFIDPLFRLLLLLPPSIFFHVHDCQSMPYFSKRLNLLQCLTTIALLVVTICNILPAIIYTNNIRISNLYILHTTWLRKSKLLFLLVCYHFGTWYGRYGNV